MEHKYEVNGAVIQVCLLAGKIMLENGGETYRVEDTMMRIAASFGADVSHAFVMPTGIIFAIDGLQPVTRLVRISQRSTNLNKVTQVNDISRRIASGLLSVQEAQALLAELEKAKPIYSPTMQLALAALASGCFLIMFQGRWADVPAAIVTGGVGFWFAAQFIRLTSIRLFGELIASLVVGLLSLLASHSGMGHDLDLIMIASVMPLVPGLLITNAVRDLMAGHLISGISKGAEAFLTAFAIGAGIGLVLTLNG